MTRPDATTATVLVVGAGLSGLVAASRLAAAGHHVTVVDKGRGVGGRLATRRMGTARLDHGAQFFTVRGDELAALVRAWSADGVVRVWCRGFRSPPDGHPRYVGSTGMTDVAKAVAAGLVDVRAGVRLGAVRREADGRWSATLDGGAELAGSQPSGAGLTEASRAGAGGPLRADAVVCTPPVPQTLALLAAGTVGFEPAAADALSAIRYDPTLAALVTLDGPGSVPAPGGVQLDDGPLSWVGDNRAKGISPVPALTLHAAPVLSRALLDGEPGVALAELLAAGAPWLGAAGVLEAQSARWRYATPVVLHDERCLVAVDGDRPLVCAGDAFGEARVEGAARSGLAAAEAVLARIGSPRPPAPAPPSDRAGGQPGGA